MLGTAARRRNVDPSDSECVFFQGGGVKCIWWNGKSARVFLAAASREVIRLELPFIRISAFMYLLLVREVLKDFFKDMHSFRPPLNGCLE